MPLVKVLSAHPYKGRLRAMGETYEANDADVELLKGLKRVTVVTDRDVQRYRTRDMRSESGIVTTRGTVPVTNQTGEKELEAALTEAEPKRRGKKPAGTE